ncbi:YfiR family protein [Acinetobacter nectaris]|uniref:YfiR family protein n=1 Tax=Acinetobacter nectaris TaxID=1219382 RepID=UPI003B00464D|nr:YfiR family protein [Acinetobacter nectaris]
MYFLKFQKIFLCLCFVLFPICSSAVSIKNFYELTFSILSYVKWDSENQVFCILNNEQVASNFSKYASDNHYSYKVYSISDKHLSKSPCSIIFFTSNIPTQQQNILLNKNLNNIPISFILDNSDCDTSIIFCIYRRKEDFTFNVNLDALSQSHIHIDPRVLLLVKEAN